MNCKTYDDSFAFCLECASGYYFNAADQICTQVDPLCKGYSPLNGFCLDCYLGFDLE